MVRVRTRNNGTTYTDGIELEDIGTSTRHGAYRNDPYRRHQSHRNIQRQMSYIQERLKEAREDLQRLRSDEQHYEAQLEKSHQDIEELRAQLINSAAKTTKLPDRSLMHRSRNDILDRWQGFTYDVRNLVMNHFRFDDTEQNKLRDWAKKQGPDLQEITPSYMEMITKVDYNSHLAEAIIWNTLLRLVFGQSGSESPVRWAGKFGPSLSKLNGEFYRDLDLARSEDNMAIWHRWRTLTTNIMSLANPQLGSVTSPRTDEVVKALDHMLAPIYDQSSQAAFRRALQRIVHEAVRLDQLFWGQDAFYFLSWPHAGRHDFPLDEDTMKVVGGGEDSPKVKFVVQPALCQVGGDRDKEYRDWCALEKFPVCV